jgi:hypothetical protein
VIKTGNPQLDAVFADLQAQIQFLSESSADKAGKIAVLTARLAELEKPAEAPKEPTLKAVE